jgi:hypothetical protein
MDLPETVVSMEEHKANAARIKKFAEEMPHETGRLRPLTRFDVLIQAAEEGAQLLTTFEIGTRGYEAGIRILKAIEAVK